MLPFSLEKERGEGETDRLSAAVAAHRQHAHADYDCDQRLIERVAVEGKFHEQGAKRRLVDRTIAGHVNQSHSTGGPWIYIAASGAATNSHTGAYFGIGQQNSGAFVQRMFVRG